MSFLNQVVRQSYRTGVWAAVLILSVMGIAFDALGYPVSASTFATLLVIGLPLFLYQRRQTKKSVEMMVTMATLAEQRKEGKENEE